MSDLNDLTQNVNIWNDEKSKSVTVTTDGAKERLDVTTNIEDNQLVTINPHPGTAFRAFLLNTASSDMTVDGSSTPVTFLNGPAAGKIWYTSNITIIIEDTAMNFAKFGGIAALTNGCDFKVKEDGGSLELIDNIKRNGGFYQFANSVILESSTTDLLVVQVNVGFSSRTSIKMNGDDSDNFTVIINDNLTTLNEYYVVLRGYEVDA